MMDGMRDEREEWGGWPMVRLSTVCRIQNGWAFDGEGFSAEAGTPLIRIRDLKTNAPSLRYVGEYPAEYVVRTGDLLVGMDGEFRCYRWGGPEALLNQRVCRLLAEESRLVPGYLHHLLDKYLREIEDRTSFTTVKHLSSRDVEALLIPLPPLAEQHRIASRLTERLAAVERARAAAESRLAAAQALPAAYLREVFESKEAQGWERRRLSSVLRDTRNGLYKPGSFYGSGIPILKMYNIGRFDGRWNLDRLDLIRLDAAEHELYGLVSGDILINRVNSRELVGKCAMIDDGLSGAVFESKNIRARVDPSTEPRFFSYWLNSAFARTQIESRIKQIVGMATLNREDLDSLEMPFPPSPTNAASPPTSRHASPPQSDWRRRFAPSWPP